MKSIQRGSSAELGHASPRAALNYQRASSERDRVLADALSRLVGTSLARAKLRLVESDESVAEQWSICGASAEVETLPGHSIQDISPDQRGGDDRGGRGGDDGVETMGLESTTPCLQIRPRRTLTNGCGWSTRLSEPWRIALNCCGCAMNAPSRSEACSASLIRPSSKGKYPMTRIDIGGSPSNSADSAGWRSARMVWIFGQLLGQHHEAGSRCVRTIRHSTFDCLWRGSGTSSTWSPKTGRSWRRR
jgi:hypothetical protein